MPRIRVLYFAELRDRVRTGEETLELASMMTVGDLSRHLEHVHPELAGRLASVRIAVNESFAEPDERVDDGDVIALIPPVAGG